jgi:hypothetical protein
VGARGVQLTSWPSVQGRDRCDYGGTSTALALGLIALLVPAMAQGETATLIDDTVRYEAAAGEANRVQVVFVPGGGQGSRLLAKSCVSVAPGLRRSDRPWHAGVLPVESILCPTRGDVGRSGDP